MKPFIKWAGGKRWLTSHIRNYVPKTFNTYIEPFLGSGAVYFSLAPSRARLSDANAELVTTYLAVRDSPNDVYRGLVELQRKHSRSLYYEIRRLVPISEIEIAVRFLYLNRTCWNGLYRVNKRNEFNVPIGTKNKVVFPDDNFEAISASLKDVDITVCDFEESINRAGPADLIYADPPYTVSHNSNGFIKYNQAIFSWEDQIRLRDSLFRAIERGAHLLLSNADNESVKKLYVGVGNILTINRMSVIAGNSSGRKKTAEILVVKND